MTVVPKGYFLAEYYLETSSGGLRKAAEKIASEETTGSWVGGGQPTTLYEKARGQVHRLEEIEPDRKGIATIAFPTVNLPLDPYLVPSLWLFLTGGPLFERLFCDRVRMLDFHLPAEMLSQLPGPKFGVAGCRKFLGLPPDELMVATIIKPCAGLTAEEVAGKCYEAALGGIDFIKDDEKMNNPDYCPLEKKVKLVAEALRRAYEQTGRKVIYCPHISSRADHMVDMARRAVDNGATGLMINCFATGFPALSRFAQRHGLQLSPRRTQTDAFYVAVLRKE
jgi:ribulose 1,5-bisphosphate carboxylase large subunit-like protein